MASDVPAQPTIPTQPAIPAPSIAGRVPPHAFFLVSAVFHYLGPSFAVLLFARLAPTGVAWLRIASAGVVFVLWRRPWRVAAGMKVTVNESVCGEETLGLLGRFEPLHLPFPSVVSADASFRPDYSDIGFAGARPGAERGYRAQRHPDRRRATDMLDALDADEDLVNMPFVAWLWPAASQTVGEAHGEFLAPASHRLVGNDDTALSGSVSARANKY
jgi:hypothetical protein